MPVFIIPSKVHFACKDDKIRFLPKLDLKSNLVRFLKIQKYSKKKIHKELVHLI